MVFCVETELPQGFREYGQQVDEMEDGQDGDEFVKRVSKRFTEEQEDSYRVASNSKRADNQLHYTLQDKTQKSERGEGFIRSLEVNIFIQYASVKNESKLG